jgi:acyl-homoserine-lactone acylase
LSGLESTTFEQVCELAYDTGLYWPKEMLPQYAKHLEKLRVTDPQLAAKVEPYLGHLLDWDCRVTAESTQAALCEAWYEELYGMDYPAETLLPAYADKPDRQLAALVSAADKLKARHGNWRIAWGELFRAQRQPQLIDLTQVKFDDNKPSLQSLGAPGPLGVVLTQYYAPSMSIPYVVSMNKRYGLVGTSYMAVYEFGPKIRSASVLNFGQSGDPASPHYFDQAKLLSEKKLKTDLFDWDDVVAGAKLVYHPGEPPLGRVAH